MTAAETEQEAAATVPAAGRQPGEPLRNQQHEAFAREVAAGAEAQDAYCKAFTHSSRKSAGRNGHRLLNNDLVRARVTEMQAAAATATVLSMSERREMLAKAARTVEMEPRDLATVLLADAKLAGELIDKVEAKDTTPREPLDAVRARIAAAAATHGRS